VNPDGPTLAEIDALVAFARRVGLNLQQWQIDTFRRLGRKPPVPHDPQDESTSR
jgi:hypothetical protein